MKIFAILSFILTISCICYANNTIEKIKEIDDNMYQGAVEYNEVPYQDKLVDKKNDLEVYFFKGPQTLIYNSDGKYKSKRSTIKSTQLIFFDGENKISVSNDSIFIAYDSNNKEESSIISDIIALPSIRYGRGLSILQDIKYNLETKEVFGNLINGNKIIAKVDPNYQYIATNIKVYNSNGNLIHEIKNKKPILIDKQYYITSESIDISDNKESKINIISATFNEPSKKDLFFNMDNFRDLKVVIDTRSDNMVVFHSVNDVKDMSLEEILKITKKKKQKNKEIEELKM